MKKSFIITSLTALAAFCLCVAAQAQGPVVVSDKDDYHPRETAMFQAAGFQPTSSWILASLSQTRTANGSRTSLEQMSQPTLREALKSITLRLKLGQTKPSSLPMGLSSGLVATTTLTDSVTDVNITAVKEWLLLVTGYDHFVACKSDGRLRLCYECNGDNYRRSGSAHNPNDYFEQWCVTNAWNSHPQASCLQSRVERQIKPPTLR